MKKILLTILVIISLLTVAIPAVGCNSSVETTSLEISPAVCFPGEEAMVSATIQNNSNNQGNYMVMLFVDNALEWTQTIALTPGSSQPVSFNLFRFEPGSYSVQIGNMKSTFTVLSASNLNITPSSVQSDEPVTVTADLRNGSSDPIDYHCGLFCQGEEVVAQDITIAGNTTETVTFTTSQTESGSYELELAGLFGSFEVLKSAGFAITSLDVSPSAVVVGQESTITVGIDNTGEVAGTYQADLLVDGVTEHTWWVNIAPDSETVYETITLSRDVPGRYTIQVDTRKASLDVVIPEQPRSGTYIVRELDNGYSKFQIINRAELDLVVALTLPEDPENAIIAMYVQADDIYTIQRIPPGIYYLFYVFGEDWDPDSLKFINSALYGKGIHYYEFDEKDDVKITKWTVTFTQDNIEIVSAWHITEDEFPSLH